MTTELATSSHFWCSVFLVNHDLVKDVPDGLTRRAIGFVLTHGIRIDTEPVEGRRQRWSELGVPPGQIDRVVAYQQRWGGLILPPGPVYDGGPRYFDPDIPEGSEGEGWWFEAGPQRAAVPYTYMVGPASEFGIHADRWVALYETVEGWVESLALSHHAHMWAKQITRLSGGEVDRIVLDGYEPVVEVAGLADSWWRGTDSLIAIYTGEAECLSAPQHRTALIYSGLDKWGLGASIKAR